MNFLYLQNESKWLDGLVTRYAEIGGVNMLGNIDGRISNVDTLRQIEIEGKFIKDIEIEGKFIKDDKVHVKTGQLLDKKVEQCKNPDLQIHLVAYNDHRKTGPSDIVFVKDLRATLEIPFFGSSGKDFPLSEFVPFTRQSYNMQVNNWLTRKIDNFDFKLFGDKSSLHDFFWP